MVHPLLMVQIRSVVWFAALLIQSDGRVAEFDKLWQVLCGRF